MTTISEESMSSQVLEELGTDNKNSVLENMHLKIMLHYLDILPKEKADTVSQTVAEGIL